MIDETFLNQSIALLEEIENTPDKKAWCEAYTVWEPCPGQEALERAISEFHKRAYEAGVVVTNYREIIEARRLNDRDIAAASPAWAGQRSCEEILACIAWHFRRDHFSNGELICGSIASGALLQLFQRLAQVNIS